MLAAKAHDVVAVSAGVYDERVSLDKPLHVMAMHGAEKTSITRGVAATAGSPLAIVPTLS